MDTMIVPVFDIGGVFIDWDPINLYRKLFDTEEDARWFLETVCTPDWNLNLDAGHDYDQAIAELSCRYPAYHAQIAAYDTRWEEMIAGIFTDTVALHDTLIMAGIPTFAITNFSRKKWMTMLPHWPFMQKFDGVVVSGIEGLVKPDPRLYQLFCDRYGLSPETCLFIDDNPTNVAAAQSFGMNAVQFTDAATLKQVFIDYGLPIPD